MYNNDDNKRQIATIERVPNELRRLARNNASVDKHAGRYGLRRTRLERTKMGARRKVRRVLGEPAENVEVEDAPKGHGQDGAARLSLLQREGHRMSAFPRLSGCLCVHVPIHDGSLEPRCRLTAACIRCQPEEGHEVSTSCRLLFGAPSGKQLLEHVSEHRSE